MGVNKHFQAKLA